MKRILIVDDDFKIRRVYCDLLTSEGYEVGMAKSAEEATEILLRQNFDVVLLDINMPDIDGTVMREVLEAYDESLKIIVSSVYPVERQKRLILKAHDYYDKAQSTGLLIGKIKELVKD